MLLTVASKFIRVLKTQSQETDNFTPCPSENYTNMNFYLLQAIMDQSTEEVRHPVHSGEQTERCQQSFISQLNAAGVHNGLIDPQGMAPLQVVPSRYPDRLTELRVENLNSNVNEMQMVPLYQLHSGGRQPMQYDVLAGGVQFNDGAEARPLTSQMHCGRRRTYATESVDEIRSVEETSQFPERNQAREHTLTSSLQRLPTFNRSVYYDN